MFKIDSLERSFLVSNEGPCILGETAKELLGRDRGRGLKVEGWGGRIFCEKPGTRESTGPLSASVCLWERGREGEGDVRRSRRKELSTHQRDAE